ncbi:hypothetical protein MNR02_14820 [Shinella sp. H4-D48]|uniref:hypothetical protein n=1 Tax=Shinella sp. H4-D48 TaxID=2925841 RepID=UPI001F52CA58|nr:hypothetical protein [Shinella sp. H4-D48]UNK37721.1 hypothetical protein MNR02_14820 [Shinella sp. H4-D48]
MFVLTVSTVSLAKPVSLRKAAPKATVSLAERQTSAYSPTNALMVYFARQDDLHAALGRSDSDAGRDVAMAMLKMELAADEYRYLSGRTLNARAAIRAAFGTQDINRGHWRLDGSKVLSLVEALERVQRRAA